MEEKRGGDIVLCEKCKNEIVAEKPFCPECGWKVGTKKKSKKRIMLWSIIVLVLVSILAGGFYVYQYNENKKKEAKQQEEIENQAKLDKMYAQLLYATGLKIEIGSAKDILICAQISKDWSTAITKGKDFNDAIQNTLKIAEDGGLMQTIRDEKESIDTAMNKLNEPPKQYKELYDKLLSLYGEYSKVYEQTISPSGSLLTYNSSIKEMSSEITRLSSEFRAIVPQEIVDEVKPDGNE